MERPLPQSWSSHWHPTIARYNGTLQQHHVHSPKVGRHPNHSTLQWHPTMAPSDSTTSTPLKLVVTFPPNHGTLQWHPAMAPRPLPQSWSSPSPPTIAHYNGTLRWHPAIAPRPLPSSWSSPSPPTIAHCNGTLRWHPAVAPRQLHPAMAPWCHVQSAKVVRRPPPLLEVRTPIAIAIWGIKEKHTAWS